MAFIWLGFKLISKFRGRLYFHFREYIIILKLDYRSYYIVCQLERVHSSAGWIATVLWTNLRGDTRNILSNDLNNENFKSLGY